MSQRISWLLQMLLAAIFALHVATSQGASREGGLTDESVCDVGDTVRSSSKLKSPFDFVKSECKNGQLLLASGVVPAGGFTLSKSEELAKNLCLIADIELKRTTGGGPTGTLWEIDNVRCKITKLPK